MTALVRAAGTGVSTSSPARLVAAELLLATTDLVPGHRVVKVLGMVNSTVDFQTHPKVINGFSDLMVEIFGENGRAARSAVGMGSLPGNIAVEIEAILELAD